MTASKGNTTPLTALCDQLEQLRAAATPGSWVTDRLELTGWSSVRAAGTPDGWERVPVTGQVAGADAALIVAAVNALPQLTAEVRRLAGVVQRVEALAEQLESEAEAERREMLQGKTEAQWDYHRRRSLVAGERAVVLRTALATVAGQ